MIDKIKSEAITKFLNRFTNTATRVLYGALDKDVYKKIEFIISSSEYIEDLNELKENNVIYHQTYTKNKKNIALAVLIPEKLVSSIADVFMGGKGDADYSGSLTELELNATYNLLNTVFPEIEALYNKLCEHEITFDNNSVLLDKSSSEYNNLIANLQCDFIVNYVLKFNNSREYHIKALLNFAELNRTLARMGVFNMEAPVQKRNLDAVNIDVIADLEINLTAELGSTELPMKCALELSQGSLIELNTYENSNIKVFSKGVEVAEAQIVVVGDNLGLRLTKLISPEERCKSIK